MKKLTALLLTGIMAFGLISCGNKEEPTPDTTTMPENMESMAAPIDAMARCMLETGMYYEPEDHYFFWTSLFYFTGAYGLDHELVEEDEGTYRLKVPAPVMQEHAAALFADYDDLLELPDMMEGNISYDNDWDAYFVSMGDIGLSETRLTDYAATEDGYTLTAELWGLGETEELLASYEVSLKDNAYVDGIEDPLYFYSVSDMKMTENNTASAPGTGTGDSDIVGDVYTDAARFNGLADSHTVELTLSDGSVQAFQFKPDSDLAKVFSSLMEGDGVYISYAENAGGAMEILSVE